MYCYAWNEPIGTWDILGREPESVAKKIILVEKKEEAGGEKPPEIDTHTGFLLVQCCNACPTLLSNYRVLDEWAEPKVLLSLPATSPDGLYAVDAVYTPGVAYKVPGLTLMRPFVLTCDCAAKVVSVSYHPRFIEPVIPWEVGKDRPKKFPDKWPKPYKSTPGDSEK